MNQALSQRYGILFGIFLGSISCREEDFWYVNRGAVSNLKPRTMKVVEDIGS